MPRTVSKRRAIIESESESESASDYEAPAAPAPKPTRKAKAPPPPPSESEEEEDLETLLQDAQELFTKTYERKIRRTKGKGPSVLPDNTNLYIKLKNNATGKSQWKVVVYGKSNAASDEALKVVEKHLDELDYKVSYRVEKPRLF